MNVAAGIAILGAVLISACTQQPAPAANANECVVLLHGLARTSLSMQRMNGMLEKNG